MVWNNNQQTHGAPGKISQPPHPPTPICARGRKTSLGFTTTVPIFRLYAGGHTAQKHART